MKQWELKNNSRVLLPEGKVVTFLKMDGSYAHWDDNGELRIGNFEEFEETEDGYKVVDHLEKERQRIMDWANDVKNWADDDTPWVSVNNLEAFLEKGT